MGGQNFTSSKKFPLEQGSSSCFYLAKGSGLRVCSHGSPWATQPAHPAVHRNHLGLLLWYPVIPVPLAQKSCGLLWLTRPGCYSQSFEQQRGQNLQSVEVRILREVWWPKCLQPLLALCAWGIKATNNTGPEKHPNVNDSHTINSLPEQVSQTGTQIFSGSREINLQDHWSQLHT